MTSDHTLVPAAGDPLPGLLQKLDRSLHLLEQSPGFAKPAKVPRVLDIARRVLLQPGGCHALQRRAAVLERAGVFDGSDWATPHILVPGLTRQALLSADPTLVVIEALSELRILAVAQHELLLPDFSASEAHHFLTQVLAVNLAVLFMPLSEADRVRQGRLAQVARHVLKHLAEAIGYEHILDRLIDEIWRILQQRPIQVETVKQMITQIAACRADPDIPLSTGGQGAERLVSSLYSPTEATRDDPGLDVYNTKLDGMDQLALRAEANGFARAMHDTGLVSPYHPVLIQRLLQLGDDHLLVDALGLSATGRDCLLCYRLLVIALLQDVATPATAQALYGMALLLERGILYQPPVAPALWRQLSLVLSPWAAERLHFAFGDGASPRIRLLEGVLSILGLPLGVGQGNNPTCQSARALSMWAYNDPDYLLQMVAWAARDNEIIMHFEGQPVSSRDLTVGVAAELPMDLDPVSLIVVPHLDRIYVEMGRRCIGREGDPHRWVNPEFHGWWAGRGFRINVDVATGHLVELDDFLRHFYAAYHPFYNGNQPLIHPQPAGIAITDSSARFVGWHAITLLRVALDPEDAMRVYFYNPNNDSGQDWGGDVVVSTRGHGERFGEASLPFDQFASRLYIFHFDPLERGKPANVPPEELQTVVASIIGSWGMHRVPAGELQAGGQMG